MRKRTREVSGIWLRRSTRAAELLIEFDGIWHNVRIFSGTPDPGNPANWPCSEIIEMVDSNFAPEPKGNKK